MSQFKIINQLFTLILIAIPLTACDANTSNENTAGSDTDTNSDADANADNAAGTDSGTDADSDTNTGYVRDTDTNVDTDTSADTGSDTGTDAGADTDSDTHPVTQYDITVNYTVGTDISPPIIYTIWIENAAAGFITPIYICDHVLANDLTDTVLPYWSLNKKNSLKALSKNEIDAVSGATVQSADFTVSHTVSIPDLSTITVYMEVDHSFDENDWFTQDQPAILYATPFDLPTTSKTKDLSFIGWTANEGTENIIPNTPKGILQSETGYITHHNDNGSFGATDNRTATDMIGSLSATIAAH